MEKPTTTAIPLCIMDLDGDTLFTYSCKNNTIKLTLEEAVRRKVNLYRADFSGVNLSRANLSGAILPNANFQGADLYGVNFTEADLYNANFYTASLNKSNLKNANFHGANMGKADLSEANLYMVNLSNASLYKTVFSGARMSKANISGAYISEANLTEVKGLKHAACYFHSHGETGRQLLAVEIKGTIQLFCGCFKGSEEKLREYIESEDENLKESRLLALETVLKLINYKQPRNTDKKKLADIEKFLSGFQKDKIEVYVAEMLDDIEIFGSSYNEMAKKILADGKDVNYLIKTHNEDAEDYGLPKI